MIKIDQTWLFFNIYQIFFDIDYEKAYILLMEWIG